jgi:hypothetical protein
LLEWLAIRILNNTGLVNSVVAATREQAANRVFTPPKVGYQIRCPKCGSPNAVPPLFDELLGFFSNHCGSEIKATPPSVQ